MTASHPNPHPHHHQIHYEQKRNSSVSPTPPKSYDDKNDTHHDLHNNDNEVDSHSLLLSHDADIHTSDTAPTSPDRDGDVPEYHRRGSSYYIDPKIAAAHRIYADWTNKYVKHRLGDQITQQQQQQQQQQHQQQQ